MLKSAQFILLKIVQPWTIVYNLVSMVTTSDAVFNNPCHFPPVRLSVNLYNWHNFVVGQKEKKCCVALKWNIWKVWFVRNLFLNCFMKNTQKYKMWVVLIKGAFLTVVFLILRQHNFLCFWPYAATKECACTASDAAVFMIMVAL